MESDCPGISRDMIRVVLRQMRDTGFLRSEGRGPGARWVKINYLRQYVDNRNSMHTDYRYRPNELYDLTVLMLFKQLLHTHESYSITFARRGRSDRTNVLRQELEETRLQFLQEQSITHDPEITVLPLYSWQSAGLQVADYCLWALQRCYERHESRFIHALWKKVSFIHDVDDPNKKDGRYLSRKADPPDPREIKNRWI